MKYNYTVEVTVDNETVQNTTHKTVETAMHAAKKAAVDHARALQVDEYIARIREGINKGYRALVADYWEEFFSSPAFFEMTNTAPFEEDSGDYLEDIPEEETDYDDEDYEYEEPAVDPLDDFNCYHQEFDITEFYFGRELHMETNWFQIFNECNYDGWISALESEGFIYGNQRVFDMRTLDHRIVVTVSRIQKTTHSENIVMVYSVFFRNHFCYSFISAGKSSSFIRMTTAFSLFRIAVYFRLPKEGRISLYLMRSQ